jgi:hypothetical protein
MYIEYEKANKAGMLYRIWKRLNHACYIKYEKLISGMLYRIWKD